MRDDDRMTPDRPVSDRLADGLDDRGDGGPDDVVDAVADARALDDDAVPLGEGDPRAADLESQWQRTEDEALADRRVSSIQAGRRKGGVMGAAMAGAMLAIQEIYEGPKKDDMVAVSESPDEPGDIDKDGILVTVGDVEVETRLPGSDEGTGSGQAPADR